MGNNNKRLGQIHKELNKLRADLVYIEAKHTKEILLDNTYDSMQYNNRYALQKADITIAIKHDSDYQKLLNQVNELEAEQIELGDLEL